jgi:acyl-CoA thioesterase II
VGTTLAEVLDVADAGRTGGDRCFTGRSPQSSPPRVFGGQLVAQALAAAGRTVPAELLPHSVHAHFLDAGDPAEPLTYRVESLREGAGRTVRRVSAHQAGRTLCSVVASFARPRPGPRHPVPVTPVVPPVDAVPQGATAQTRRWVAALGDILPLEIRFPVLPPRDAVERGGTGPGRQRVLVRAADPLPADPLVHACALAYASDLLLLSTALAPHGLLMGSPAVRAVSLDHAVWFHGRVRVGR